MKRIVLLLIISGSLLAQNWETPLPGGIRTSTFAALPAPGAYPPLLSLITDNITGTACSANSSMCYSNGLNWYQVALPTGGGGSGSLTSFAAPSGNWPSWLVPTVTNPTTTPSLAVTLASQTAHFFFAAPSGSAGTPIFRVIVASDVPTLNQSTTGNALTATGFDHNPTQCSGTDFSKGIDAGGNSTCATPAGTGGTVSTSGSPAAPQYAKFTGSTIITGQAGIPGADITGSRTVPQTTLPLGTTGAPGILQCDGTTITCPGGVASSTGGFTIGTNGTLLLSSGILDTINSVVPRLTSTSVISGLWTYNIGQDWVQQASGTTPGAGKIHPYANTDTTPHYVTPDGIDHTFGSSAKTWIKGSTTATTVGTGGVDLSFDVNDADNTGSAITHSTSSNPERFTATIAGYYGGSCSIDATLSASDAGLEVIWHHGSTDTVLPQFVLLGTTRFAVAEPFEVHMGVGDYLRCNVYSSTTLTIGVATSVYMVVENR